MRKIIDKLLKRRTFNITVGEIMITSIPKIKMEKDYWFPSPDLDKKLKRKESINNIFYKKNF